MQPSPRRSIVAGSGTAPPPPPPRELSGVMIRSVVPLVVELVVQLAHRGIDAAHARSTAALEAMMASRLEKYRDRLEAI